MRPLTLQLGLSAIREGSELIRHGRAEAGLRLIEHGAEYLDSNQPKVSERLREHLRYKYAHIGCPAAHMEDNCPHPDDCADNGRCIDLGPPVGIGLA